ncbi:OmpH family outer membrane protein [Zunongwangia sp.]|uniref:OmpH family outer membrane protein n=1 Tax=Zunongwangia sp. TaxID=1965325 RepID=UPI003AA922A4
MKKLSFIITFLCIALNTNAQSKIAIIDADYIISKMPEISDVDQGIKNFNEQMQSDMKSAIKTYQGLVQNYKDSSAVFTEDIKKERENTLISLENDIKNFRQRSSVMLQMKRNELTKPLYAKIDTALQEIIKEEGYTQVFHANSGALAYSEPSSDITEKVLNKLGIKVEENPADNTAINSNPNSEEKQ